MNKSATLVRVAVSILILCTFLLVGTVGAKADGCRLPISIRGNTDLQEHTHFLRVYMNPNDQYFVHIYYNGSIQYLDTAGAGSNYVDYYISTWFVNTHRWSWNNTSYWSATGPCVGGGGGGGGVGSW